MDKTPSPPRRALTKRWAERIYRIYEVDPLTFRQCGSQMKIRAIITRTRACAPSHLPKKNGFSYPILFRFKREGSAVLGLLWTREEGEWRIIAVRAFEQ